MNSARAGRHAAIADLRQRLATGAAGQRHVEPRRELRQRPQRSAGRLTLATQFPLTGADGSPNNLAVQLQTVARIIKVRSALGLSRQIFYCNLDGFDTHGGQLSIQARSCNN